MYLTREKIEEVLGKPPKPTTLGELHDKIYRFSSGLKSCVYDDEELSIDLNSYTQEFGKEFLKSSEPLKLLDILTKILLKVQDKIKDIEDYSYVQIDMVKILEYIKILEQLIKNNKQIFNSGPILILGDWEKWEEKCALIKSQIPITY